jgi:hypothetical protein
MLRIIHGGPGASPRLIEERAFIAEVGGLDGTAPALRGGASCPLPCTIESVDGLGRLRWRAYCSTRDGLLDLARELGQERSMAARSGTSPRRAS